MREVDRYRSFDINFDTFFERFMDEHSKDSHKPQQETQMNNSQVAFDETGQIDGTVMNANAEALEETLMALVEDFNEIGYSKDEIINFINENF